MVYETVHGEGHPEFVLCSPKVPSDCSNLHGLYFLAHPSGKMNAYEYTTEPSEDLSAYTSFVVEFARAVCELGVRNMFALTAKKPGEGLFVEYEMSGCSSTILVRNPTWLPQKGRATSTDWIATKDSDYIAQDPNVPDIIKLKCTVARSNTHGNVTCSVTRTGRHYQQKECRSHGDK